MEYRRRREKVGAAWLHMSGQEAVWGVARDALISYKSLLERQRWMRAKKRALDSGSRRGSPHCPLLGQASTT
jgi:hypothetical protein